MGFKITQWNCRGFRSNSHWLRSPCFVDSQVFCLQETFLDPSHVISFPRMHIFSACRSGGHGGGLLTAVHSSTPSFLLSLPPESSGSVESLGVKINVGGGWLTIVNIYLPRGSFVEGWFDQLLASIDPPFLILGDFNINILRSHPPFSSDLQRFHSWALNHNLYICNTTVPTRCSLGSTASLLDLSLASPFLHGSLSCSVHPDPFDSDHQPVFLSLDDNRASPHSDMRRSFVNWTKASLQLNAFVENFSAATLQFQPFLNACQDAMSRTTGFSRTASRKSAPWWDATCRKLLGLKRKYLRLSRSLCSRDFWLLYKQTSCRLRRYIKQVSRQYWDSVCRTSGSNGQIYKILKNLARKQSPLGDNVLWSGGPVASRHAQANLFLEIFGKEDPLHPLPYDLSDGDPHLDAPFTMGELLHAIHNTRATTPGRDGISIKLLQGLSVESLGKVLTLFNELFDTAMVPPSWKEATIVPICKPGKPPHLAGSYRPIALTSVCAKVFERILLYRLVLWTGRNNTFHPSHYGFLPFRDCTAALCKFYEDISNARSSRQAAYAVCLDIRSAYDSIWVDGLLFKLAALGIRGKLGRWLANFLTNRVLCIRWRSVYSGVSPCRRGVPQGSVLSPILFMFFMSDIFDILESGVHLLLYADDIILYGIGADAGRTLAKLQSCLDRLVHWCNAFHLSISPDKCLAIDFSRKRISGTTVKLLGVDLEWSAVVKILGVWFGRSLIFNHHFSYLRAKAFKRMNYLKAVVSHSRGVNSNHMLKITNALIRSLLEYACPLFLNASPTSLNSLDVIYNAALRVATGLPKCTPLPLLRREADASPMVSRIRCLSHRFLFRQLSLPWSPFSMPLAARSGYLSACVVELLAMYNIEYSSIIQFSWPSLPHFNAGYKILMDGLPFHITAISDAALLAAWSLWRAALPTDAIVISSDASKDAFKTSIAAFHERHSVYVAQLINHLNSIFTAEALALFTALSSYVNASGNYFLLTDSKSVLQSLRNISLRSPRVILWIHNLLCKLLLTPGIEITLVWCPGHKGIPVNEIADSYARNGPYLPSSLKWVAAEDLCSRIRNDWNTEKDYSWMNSDYYQEFPHLSNNFRFRDWTCSRREDVWISRWRTRTWLTNHRLYKMKLASSPLCSLCCTIETPDHVLLSCSKYTVARLNLLSSLNLPSSASFSDVLSAATGSLMGIRALVLFSSFVSSN